MTGRILVLHGPSSAGKSTLADAIQRRVGPKVAVVGIDRLFAVLHPGEPTGWAAFAALSAATFASAAALADGGYDVVVDTVFERAECLDLLDRALGERRRWLIGVTAPVETLEARERTRGDRRPGLARGHHARVLGFRANDLVVDTHAEPTEALVDRILAHTW